VLLDFNNVIVHLMLPEIREKYQLETLWGKSAK
jgi:ribosomal silencing factor RsfS